MYGRIFQRMYQGSMVGAGSTVFAVWGYCIANADPDNHTVDLNPALLAAVIGETKENIEKAISYLASEDLNSHNKSHDGRRLVNTTGYEYFLPSHEDYRKILNGEDLRQYFRTKKREQRAVSKTVKDMSATPVYVSDSDSSLILKGSAEGEHIPAWEVDFEEVWKLYPDKSGKNEARKAYQKAMKEGTKKEDIITGIARYANYIHHQRTTGFPDRRVKGGGSWFLNKSWQNEYTMEDKSNAKLKFD